MLPALRYLEAVLPANGLRVVAFKPPKWSKGLKHLFLATNDDVIRETTQLDKAGITSYIALATYTSPDGGRVAENAAELQSLWLDIDFKNYDDPKHAYADIKKLVGVVGALTLLVSSGGGLHAYWALRDPLPKEQWRSLAESFQNTWKGMGIKADPISADAARILRLPGTHNRKPEYGEPREVKVEIVNDINYDATVLANKLGSVPAPAKVLPVAITAPPALYDENDDLGAGFEQRPSYIEPLISRCLQVQHAFVHQDTYSEPQWFAVIQLIRHLDDGPRLAHAFSCKHPGYSKQATDEKLAQLESKDIGPTTCARFKLVNPAGCEGCQYHITSPIQLGYKEVEPVEPTVTVTEKVVDEDTGEVIVVERDEQPDAQMPEGYKFDGHSVFKNVKDPETQMWREEEIFRGFICPERIISDARNNHLTEVQLYVHPAGQPPKRVIIPSKSTSDKRLLVGELASRGIYVMSKNANHILDFLQKMVRDVQSKKRDAIIANQMGWQDDGVFVVGSTGYRANHSPLFDLPIPAGTKAVARSYEPVGSLEAWKNTARIYAKEGGEAYQFALCYGAAGLILPMTSLSGVVLSLYSQESGRGKSTAGEGALSWWGDPATLKSQSKDTNNALFSKASRHKNLPILVDEITDKPSWELEDIVYFMAQGREKERLASDTSPRPILPSWSLPVILTSNNAVKSKLQSKRGDAQGLFARIIEVSMDLPFATSMGYSDSMTLRRGFKANYGHAGPLLAKYVMENRDIAASALDNLMVRLTKAVGSDPAYRFWVASCASVLTVALLSRKLGLVDYDVQRLATWSIATMHAQRSDATATIATVGDILAQFLEQNTNRILVSYLRSIGASATAPAVWPEDGVHGNQLVGRAELPERSLYLSVSAFIRFCHEAGFDYSSFVRNAAATVDSGQVLLKSANPKHVTLGRNTKTASARTKALEFNLLHPSLREYAAGIDTKIPDATHLHSVK